MVSNMARVVVDSANPEPEIRKSLSSRASYELVPGLSQQDEVHAAMATLDGMNDFSIMNLASKLSLRVIIMVGQYDELLVPENLVEELKRNLNRKGYAIVLPPFPGGHHIPINYPSDVSAAIESLRED